MCPETTSRSYFCERFFYKCEWYTLVTRFPVVGSQNFGWTAPNVHLKSVPIVRPAPLPLILKILELHENVENVDIIPAYCLCMWQTVLISEYIFVSWNGDLAFVSFVDVCSH